MLLLLQGATTIQAGAASVRAYANTYYSTVFGGGMSFAVVNAGASGLTGVGDAAGGITPTTSAAGDITATTNGLPTEE